MKKISTVEAAKLLNISNDKLGILEKQGVIHSVSKVEGESFYSLEEINEIKKIHPSPAQRSVELARAGGVNNAAAVVAVLIFLIFVIGILAAIAIPQFTTYRTRGACAAAKSDLKNAYLAAQVLLVENPKGSINDPKTLSQSGFIKTTGCSIDISNFTGTSGFISTTHTQCNKYYIIDPAGVITEKQK